MNVNIKRLEKCAAKSKAKHTYIDRKKGLLFSAAT